MQSNYLLRKHYICYLSIRSAQNITALKLSADGNEESLMLARLCQPVFTFVCYWIEKWKVKLLIVHCCSHTYRSVTSMTNRETKISIYIDEYEMKKILVVV